MKKLELLVSFSDCDPAGVMFFANYFRLAHFAYETLSKKYDAYDSIFNDEISIFPIVKAEAKYKKITRAGEKIVIKVAVAEIKEYLFKLQFEFYSEDEKELRAIVETCHFCVDKRNFEKIKIPQKVESFLSQFLNKT